MSRAIEAAKQAHSHLHAREYLGEQTARPLITFLNAPHKSAKAKAEFRLIERILAADRKLASPVELFEAIEQFDRFLRRTRFTVKLKPSFHTSTFQPLEGYHSWQIHLDPPALSALVLLAAEGLLDRVRECARPGCGTYFFARFQRMKFHSRVCQERTFQSSEEWQERRKRYMRDLRRREKEKLREENLRSKRG